MPMNMKTILKYGMVLLAASALLVSCNPDSLQEESVIMVDNRTQNDFDKWLEHNFVNAYNTVIKYRYEMNESNYSYYTTPADMDCAIMMAHLLKYLCIDVYDEAVGPSFTRSYFPKLFFFIGEWEFNNAGTIQLGTAEGGKKIFLTGVNYLPWIMEGSWGEYRRDPKEGMNHYYIKTIHHEFTHILNQNKDYQTEFKQITSTGYVQDAWSTADYRYDHLQRGFISTYSQKDDREDFAELMSLYVTKSEDEWNEYLEKAGWAVTGDSEDDWILDEDGNHEPAPGRGILLNKIELVKAYMMDTYGVDMDVLRETILRRQEEVFSGQVDLTSLEIN